MRDFQRDASTLSNRRTELYAYKLNDYSFFVMLTDSEFDYVECYDSYGNEWGYFYVEEYDMMDFTEMCSEHLNQSEV